MQKTSTESLASKSLNALKWNYIGRFISLSLQFSIGVVLARLLGPEPFGLVAAQLSQTTLNSVGNYIYHRHAIFPLVNPKNCRLLQFGAAMTLPFLNNINIYLKKLSVLNQKKLFNSLLNIKSTLSTFDPTILLK